MIHIHAVGTRRSATVVVSGGTGVWSSQWAKIQREVSATTRVCLWDRPGFGWSDPAPRPYTARQSAEDLHQALTLAGESAPYVLVGESYGGYVARLFHDRYPSDVAGIVLVESAHEAQWEKIPQAAEMLVGAVPKLKLAVWLSRIGILRLLVSDRGEDLPADVRGALIAFQGRTRTIQAIQREIAGVIESASEVARSRTLGSLPLVVVSAGRSFDKFTSEAKEPALREMNRKWLELQANLAQLSTNSEQILVENATHGVAREFPAHTSAAIVRCLEMVRTDCAASWR